MGKKKIFEMKNEKPQVLRIKESPPSGFFFKEKTLYIRRRK